jgi:hypothetical protein
MRRTAPSLLLLISALACDRTPTQPDVTGPPPEAAAITSVTTLSQMVLGANVAHVQVDADFLRVSYRSADGSDAGVTPWQTPDAGSILVLGLLPGTDYGMWIESKRGSQTVAGSRIAFSTAPLPSGLAEVHLLFDGTPSGGYSIANIGAADSHGYVVIFDSTGALRWYRDFGPQFDFDARQQANGDITMFLGPSNGYTPAVGAFVEVTPSGDSVRAITAVGSAYTDPHELVTSYDRQKSRIADYLFGYDLGTLELEDEDPSTEETVALHKVIRISATGTVDTLINAADHWGLADAIEPPPIRDLDHPNSIDFDLDGGVIVSYRSLSAIVKVNPDTHAIEWQLGGLKNQFTILNDPLGGFDGQHSARVLPNGHLLIFDNGWTHSPQMSRAVEYELNLSAMTATMVWQYRASPPIFNDFTGSVQRLANGNTVVAFTREGTVDEVRPDGTRLSRGVLQVAPNTDAMPYRVLRINNLYYYALP